MDNILLHAGKESYRSIQSSFLLFNVMYPSSNVIIVSNEDM